MEEILNLYFLKYLFYRTFPRKRGKETVWDNEERKKDEWKHNIRDLERYGLFFSLLSVEDREEMISERESKEW